MTTTRAPRKTRAKVPPAPVYLALPASDEGETQIPEVVQAVSVALALLIEGGCETWAEFMNPDDDTYRRKALSKVIITDELGELLDKYPTILTWISRKPSTTVVVCPVCLEFSVTLGTCPSSCKITPRCEGKPIRVVRAKTPTKSRAKKSVDPDDLESLEELENAKDAVRNEAQDEYDNNPELQETLAAAAQSETVSRSH